MLKQITTMLSEADGRPLVAFAGDMSRTWYVDHYMMLDVMDILREANPRVVIVNGGNRPFDMYIEEMAFKLNLDVITYGDELPSLERLASKYDRPLEMLDGLSALIVFPRVGDTMRGVARIAPAAKEAGLPVVAVDRDGRSYEWGKKKPRRKRART